MSLFDSSPKRKQNMDFFFKAYVYTTLQGLAGAEFRDISLLNGERKFETSVYCAMSDDFNLYLYFTCS